MKAMILEELADLRENPNPLVLAEYPIPEPGAGEVRVKISTCGVCHTELDEIEGRTPPPKLPVILGHQIVGRVDMLGPGVRTHVLGDRVGIGWIYKTCGHCKFCLSGNENLCPDFQATGRDVHGGYAEYMTVPESSAYPIPKELTNAEAAPLLCAGAIGYRSLRLTNLQDGQALGLMGFGASAHLVLKTVRYLYKNVRIFAFSRSQSEQGFARDLGAVWAGAIDEESPEKLDAIIDTTPAWKPVLEALHNLAPGGRLVINAIRKEDADKEYLLNLDYPSHLWLEKEVKSVANVSRKDLSEFLRIAGDVRIKPEYHEFELKDANRALLEVKTGKIRGAKVLRIS
jgi:propanol-preferring alcohol dehydrogenase